MATPDWKGLFEWSMKHQDGTNDSQAKAMKPEERAWFEEALQHHTIDAGKRLGQISERLDEGAGEDSEAALHEKEALLDELLEIVEDIDHARDLTKIGGFKTLLTLLASRHASLRWRAAEVTATCVQNNPPVQAWFAAQGALPPLLSLLSGSDATCRQKGLLAISCLVRNYPAGMQAFLDVGGSAKLLDLLTSNGARIQRKALQLLTEVAAEKPKKVPTAGLLPHCRELLESEDRHVRDANLGLMLGMSAQPSLHYAMAQDRDLHEAIDRRLQGVTDAQESAEGDRAEERKSLESLKRTLNAPPRPALASNLTGEEEEMQVNATQPTLLLGPPRS